MDNFCFSFLGLFVIFIIIETTYRFFFNLMTMDNYVRDSRRISHLNSSFNFLNEMCELSVFQVIGLTETWLNDHNSALLQIPGDKFYKGIDSSDNMVEMKHIFEAIFRFC